MSAGESKKASTEDGDDRISGLPDEVLHRVLSYLPAREAVRISVLARRWKPLWKSNRRLSITLSRTSEPVSRSMRLASLISQHGLRRSHSLSRRRFSLARLLSVTGNQSALDVDRLNRFMNRLLLLRDPVPLDLCKFSFDGFPRVDGSQVDVWIRHALSWQVPILIAHLGTNVHTALPGQPLTSAHLVRLEFSQLEFKGRFLDFSSCMALEDLKMHACVIGVDEIFSKSLKRLKITRCNFNLGAMTHISVPSLLYLLLEDCEGQTPLLENMPSLEEAFVRLGWFDEDHCGKGTDENRCGEDTNEDHSETTDEDHSESSDEDEDHSESSDEDEGRPVLCESCCGICANCCSNDNSRACVLLGGLSSVKYLKLGPSHHMFTIKRDLQCCPTFSKLGTLVLDNWRLNIGFEALLCFLLHTPLLHTLIIDVPKEYCRSYDVDKELISQLQKFLYLPHLTVIKITYRKGGVRVCLWELLKILEACAGNLQQSNIIRIVLNNGFIIPVSCRRMSGLCIVWACGNAAISMSVRLEYGRWCVKAAIYCINDPSSMDLLLMLEHMLNMLRLRLVFFWFKYLSPIG